VGGDVTIGIDCVSQDRQTVNFLLLLFDRPLLPCGVEGFLLMNL
jgi:hypothetical protein